MSPQRRHRLRRNPPFAHSIARKVKEAIENETEKPKSIPAQASQVSMLDIDFDPVTVTVYEHLCNVLSEELASKLATEIAEDLHQVLSQNDQ